MIQPADEFHAGVKYAREAVIEFIESHIVDDKDLLTLTELIAEIKHWEAQDTKYSMRRFATGGEDKFADLVLDLRIGNLNKELADMQNIINKIKKDLGL